MARVSQQAEARRLEGAGFEELRAGHYPEAVSSFLRSADLHLQMGQSARWAHALRCAAEVQLRMRRPADALATYGMLLNAPGSDPLSRARVMNNVGLIRAREGELDQAISAFLQAEQLFLDAGDERGAAMQQGNIGSAYRDLRRSAEALVHYSLALDLYARTDDAAGMAEQCINIAYIRARQGELCSARDWYLSALPHCERCGRQDLHEAVSRNIRALENRLEGRGASSGAQ